MTLNTESQWVDVEDAERLVGRTPTRSPHQAVRAVDLMAMVFPPVAYVVPGYIAEGLTLLAGKPKIGKSWMSLDLAVAVARGGFTMGDVKCDEGDVLYGALEDNARRLQKRLGKVLQDQPCPERLEFTTSMPKLDEGGVAYLRQWIESHHKPRLIIIDVLNKVRRTKGEKETEYQADYAAVGEFKALADEHGVGIVLVHHVRKMAADDPLDTVSGTTGLTGAVDSILVLNRTSQGTTLYGRGRDIEEIEKAVQFDADICRWRVLGDAEEVQRSDARNEILAILRDSAEPMSPREISDLTDDLSYENVRQLLIRMAKAGEIQKAGRASYCHNAGGVTNVTSVTTPERLNGDEASRQESEQVELGEDKAALAHCDAVTVVTPPSEQEAAGLSGPTSKPTREQQDRALFASGGSFTIDAQDMLAWLRRQSEIDVSTKAMTDRGLKWMRRPTRREDALKRLVSMKFATVATTPSARGKPARHVTLTDKGRNYEAPE